MIRSPLRYPGGKSRAVEKIAGLILPFEEFREPFVGGGSVFIYLRQKFPGKKFWINDKYFELVNFWQQVQTHPRFVLEKIKDWKKDYNDGKTLFYFLKENQNNFGEIEKAAAFFVFNRITFSGTTEAGGFSAQAFEKRFTPSSLARLEKLPEILQGVKITNLDYQEVVEEKGKNIFLFLDPPYFSAEKSALYGKNGSLHKAFDHTQLAKIMKFCRHKWLLTYDDSKFIRESFDFAKQRSWNLMYGMRNQTSNSNQLGYEVFISNYELDYPEQKQIMLNFAK